MRRDRESLTHDRAGRRPHELDWLVGMARYQCIFIGAPGSSEFQEFDCATDAEAVTLGRRMLSARPHHEAFELRRAHSRIHVELKGWSKGAH